MDRSPLLNLHFDKGNGAVFEVEHQGAAVACFLSQDNVYLAHKASPGQSFPDIVERYSVLIGKAAAINVARMGISQDPWGNLVTEQDLEAAQASMVGTQSNNSFKPNPLRGSA